MADPLPLFPLGTVLFPGLLLPLQVFEPRYRTLMADLMSEPEPWSFGIIAIREGHEVGATSVKSLYDVGCVAVIQQVEQLPDARVAMVVAGDRRFRVIDLDETRPYLQATVEVLDEPSSDDGADLAATVREQFTGYCAGLGAPAAAASLPDDPAGLSYVVAATMLLTRELALLRTGTMPVSQPRLPPHSQN